MLTTNLALIVCIIAGLIYIFVPPKHRIIGNLIGLCPYAFAIGLFVYLFK